MRRAEHSDIVVGGHERVVEDLMEIIHVTTSKIAVKVDIGTPRVNTAG